MLIKDDFSNTCIAVFVKLFERMTWCCRNSAIRKMDMRLHINKLGY